MLKQRVLTAIVLIIGLYGGTAWLSLPYFGIFLSLILIPALLEWGRLMGLQRMRHKLLWLLSFSCAASGAWVLLSAGRLDELNEQYLTIVMLAAVAYWLWVFWVIREFPAGRHRWQARWKIGLMGIASLLPAWLGLYFLKILQPDGLLVFLLVLLVSVVDIGAYFTGRAWGKRQLAPALSPKKSWAGFWGGVASCVLLAAAVLAWFHITYRPVSLQLWMLMLLLAVLMAVLSVVGDLFESMLKRHRGIKDSGRSLPGHGGVLDRIDSLVAATPVYVLAMILLSALLGVV